MELISPRLKLREFNADDHLALREMETRPIFNTFEREVPGEAETRQSLEESISSQRDNPRTVYRLAITIQPADVVKGILKVSRLQESIGEWEIGWAVHPDEWGKGYASEAAWCAMDWAFGELKVHRMVAFCHASNRASVRVMEELGMRPEGMLREARWLNGQWWDEMVYAILEREWKANNDLRGLRPSRTYSCLARVAPSDYNECLPEKGA